MINFPRPRIRAPFRQSTISMAGMALCVFCCTLVLLNACTDETGQRLSAVTAAFQSNVEAHGMTTAAATRVRSNETPPAGPPGQNEIASTHASWPVSNSRNQRTTLDDEPIVLHDPDRDAFASFLRELSRLSTVTPVKSFDSEVTMDFLSTGSRKQEEIFTTALNVIHALNQETQVSTAEVELVIWAGTPEKSSFARAALEAAELQQAVTRQLSVSEKNALHLCTSGRIWYSETELRPALTVVIRRAVMSDE